MKVRKAMKRKIGMVIVNYNDFKTTSKLLENIKEYSCLNKIVVVDNFSTDNSVEELKKFENSRITIIKNRKNNGYASGLNTGCKYLIKELGTCNIIFSNSDIIIKDEKDIIKLSSDLGKEISVVGPVIYEHGNYNKGWKQTTKTMEILFNLPWISRYFKKKLLYYDENHYRGKTSKVDVVSGCFFMTTSEILKEVNYFDEETFLYYEELIFAKKVKEKKKQTIIDNEVEIIHDHSVTIDKNVTKIKKYRILKSSQRYYVKKYLKANSFQMALLYLTKQLSLGILYMRCLFRR